MDLNRVDIVMKARTVKRNIIPLEIHYSNRSISNGFCRTTWFKALKRIEDDPYCLVVLVGDLIDTDRPSMRAIKATMFQDIDRLPALQEDDMDRQRGLREGIIKDLKRIKDKIIGMIDGDHYQLYSNGTTSTWYIANQLGIPKTYLGRRMGWITLIFTKGKCVKKYNILIRHGKGGGNIGGDINKLISQNVGFIADLFIGGHTHKLFFYKIPHLYPGAHEIKEKLICYARAGSLLRGFMYKHTTYPELCEYNPLSIGWPEIQITMTKDNIGNINLKEIKGIS